MTQEQRQTLQAFADRATMLSAKDERWPCVQDWQRKGLVRAVVVTRYVARIEVTDAGRAALAEGAP